MGENGVMARLAFEASMVAKALAKFTKEQLDGMQLVFDTDTRKLIFEVVGLKEAQALLENYGAMSRYCRKKDIIEWAGSLILTLEEERDKE